MRSVAKGVYEGIAGLPQLELRKRPDPAGELGSCVYIGFPDKALRDRFRAAMPAANVPVSPPAGSVLLPVQSPFLPKRPHTPACPPRPSPEGRALKLVPQSRPPHAPPLYHLSDPSP